MFVVDTFKIIVLNFKLCELRTHCIVDNFTRFTHCTTKFYGAVSYYVDILMSGQEVLGTLNLLDRYETIF
jgi:hypothetical protein